jgi:hypothetical protein
MRQIAYPCEGRKILNYNGIEEVLFERFLSGNHVSIVRNIPNIRLESRVIPLSQCFRYLHYMDQNRISF